ncbi:MAG: 2-amino-4-hydroxy-6-hydroxymethyldihydropteridine diphosphokinase [Candidatus Firestonebacteria bacterium]
MKLEHIAYIGLGSNLGNRVSNIKKAVKLLKIKQEIRVEKTSSLYETEPEGYKNQPKFINAVTRIKTILKPHKLLSKCKDIEKKLKRKRTKRWGPRIIDLDILMYDSIKVKSKRLVLPHPRMNKRKFVLEPLKEVLKDK